jgi:hypothetical protein
MRGHVINLSISLTERKSCVWDGLWRGWFGSYPKLKMETDLCHYLMVTHCCKYFRHGISWLVLPFSYDLSQQVDVRFFCVCVWGLLTDPISTTAVEIYERTIMYVEIERTRDHALLTSLKILSRVRVKYRRGLDWWLDLLTTYRS